MKFLALLLFGAGLGQAVSESRHELIPAGLEKGALLTCTHDNLYHTFLDVRYSSSASTFCSNYIASISVSTAVVKATVTSYASVSDATHQVTSVVLATQTLTITTSADPAITNVPKVKLQAMPAAFAPGKAGTYPPDRISSACSSLLSPLVMIRQIAATTSTSTQNWTRHFTRLTTTIESTTSPMYSATASSSVIPLESATTNSVAVVSTDLAAESSSVALSDAAPITSVAAASTYLAAASSGAALSDAAPITSVAAASSGAVLSDAAPTSFAAASTTAAAQTSTIEESPQASPAAYCTAGDFEEPVNAGIFTPQCGASYVPANPDPSGFNTVHSYMDCAAICDAAFNCNFFSYLLTVTVDNCYINDNTNVWFPDPNVDSGRLNFS